MEIKKVITGKIGENCFIISKNNECIIVDPGDNADKIINKLDGLKVLAILLTHGHYDHISACPKLVSTYNVPVYIHEGDKDYPFDGKLNCFHYFARDFQFGDIEPVSITEGVLHIGSFNIDVLHTPGHTPGSCCFLIEGHLFSGDTLFKGTCGRTDLGQGSMADMKQSLKYLLTLDKNTVVYPGHGDYTTIGNEKYTFNF